MISPGAMSALATACLPTSSSYLMLTDSDMQGNLLCGLASLSPGPPTTASGLSSLSAETSVRAVWSSASTSTFLSPEIFPTANASIAFPKLSLAFLYSLNIEILDYFQHFPLKY